MACELDTYAVCVDAWDQDVFNDIMRDGFDWDADEDCWMPWESCSNKRIDRLFYGANATALIGILPVSLFCSGHTYFVQDMPAVIDREPYVVHATFQFSGKAGKRHRFRYVRVYVCVHLWTVRE